MNVNFNTSIFFLIEHFKGYLRNRLVKRTNVKRLRAINFQSCAIKLLQGN